MVPTARSWRAAFRALQVALHVAIVLHRLSNDPKVNLGQTIAAIAGGKPRRDPAVHAALPSWHGRCSESGRPSAPRASRQRLAGRGQVREALWGHSRLLALARGPARPPPGGQGSPSNHRSRHSSPHRRERQRRHHNELPPAPEGASRAAAPPWGCEAMPEGCGLGTRAPAAPGAALCPASSPPPAGTAQKPWAGLAPAPLPRRWPRQQRWLAIGVGRDGAPAFQLHERQPLAEQRGGDGGAPQVRRPRRKPAALGPRVPTQPYTGSRQHTVCSAAGAVCSACRPPRAAPRRPRLCTCRQLRARTAARQGAAAPCSPCRAACPLRSLWLPLCREYPTVAEAYDLVEECGRGVSATVSAGRPALPSLGQRARRGRHGGTHPAAALDMGGNLYLVQALLSAIQLSAWRSDAPPTRPGAHPPLPSLPLPRQVYRAICKPFQEEASRGWPGGSRGCCCCWGACRWRAAAVMALSSRCEGAPTVSPALPARLP